MAFTVGQTVELVSSSSSSAMAELIRDDVGQIIVELRNGDRGTITARSTWQNYAPRVTVLWHRLDRETRMTDDRLRVYVPRVSSVNVLLALQTVLREEQPHAVTELRGYLAEARGTIHELRGNLAEARGTIHELHQALDESRLLDREHRAQYTEIVTGTAERNRDVRATMERLMLAIQAASGVLQINAGERDRVYQALNAAFLEMSATHLDISYQIVEIAED